MGGLIVRHIMPADQACDGNLSRPPAVPSSFSRRRAQAQCGSGGASLPPVRSSLLRAAGGERQQHVGSRERAVLFYVLSRRRVVSVLLHAGSEALNRAGWSEQTK